MSLSFSIVCPSYNSRNTIRNTIKSIIGQDYQNWELIIVDDGSNDDSLDIVESFQKKDARIVFLSRATKDHILPESMV